MDDNYLAQLLDGAPEPRGWQQVSPLPALDSGATRVALVGGRVGWAIPDKDDDDDDDDEAESTADRELDEADEMSLEVQKLERLATLMSYLGGLQQTIQQRQVGVVMDPLATLSAASLINKSLAARKLHRQPPPAGHHWHLVYLAVVLMAVAATCLFVKMFAGRLDTKRLPLIRPHRFGRRDRHRSSWRPFWAADGSSSSSTGSIDGGAGAASSTAGTLVGEKSLHRDELGAGNSSARRRPSDLDSGLDTMGTLDGELEPEQKGSRVQFDLLTQRLLNMLKFYYNSSANSRSQDEASAAPEKSNGLDLDKSKASPVGADTEQLVADVEANVEQATRFRTSRSYIKSLIETLSKARSRVFVDDPATLNSSTDQGCGDEDDEDEEDEEENAFGTSKSATGDTQRHKLARNRRTDDETADEIVVSQMDISAAHLILDYMEKHLEDKERLRREWLELNGCDGAKSNRSKANQLVLQRLARVGSSEHNKPKNRNQSVLPFDRNRVKLGQQRQRSGAGSPTSSVKSHQQARPRRANKTTGAGPRQQQQTSDYINASFIYDDDPRRPTHIIAQGPNEQTVGQFWQMIWEQEVSLIVMLTRLNENGQRHCHCYWPTNSGANATGSPVNQAAAAAADNNSAAGNTVPKRPAAAPPASPRQLAAPFELVGELGGAAARRGSVTSVFSSSALASLSQPPIVANGDVSDNVLYFDVPVAPASAPGSSSSSTDAGKSPEERPECEQPPATVRLEVHLISEHVSSSDYLVRNMYLINRSTGETRTITQFHYLAWPENRAPEKVRSLLQFRRKVHKSYRSLASPILVHCSDGAGRSGTYTLLDIILERIKNGAKEIDPRATLEHLRDQRIGLCATQSQFEFVLVALAEEIQIILNALPK